uniref:Uncharacterized protein n=1 Tax=Phenylobacterium glaciei TaxID=2803784 RepID=A0A974P1K1_9CAUL|nr:hypothetical protein JKL49_14610 [Phenylobacterium glaciei]
MASLMVGRGGAFRGAAPGARLLVADVYGSSPPAARRRSSPRPWPGWRRTRSRSSISAWWVRPPDPAGRRERSRRPRPSGGGRRWQ